jgi:hypothetical protein
MQNGDTRIIKRKITPIKTIVYGNEQECAPRNKCECVCAPLGISATANANTRDSVVELA